MEAHIEGWEGDVPPIPGSTVERVCQDNDIIYISRTYVASYILPLPVCLPLTNHITSFVALCFRYE